MAFNTAQLNQLQYFIDNSWQVLESDRIQAPEYRFASIASRSTKSVVDSSPLYAFRHLFSEPALELVESLLNRNLALKRYELNCSFPYIDVSRDQLLQFFGAYLLLGNTYSHESRRFDEHWAECNRRYHLPFGVTKLKALFATLTPSNQELAALCSILSQRAKESVTPSSILTVDETLYAYVPSSPIKRIHELNGDPIPLVYIPRKPRPNGLLNYCLAASFINPWNTNETLPFIIDMVPYLSQPPPGHFDVVRLFMQRWAYDWKPHIVADSAFGSLNLMHEILDWGGTATLSVASTTEESLWRLLGSVLSRNQWNAAQNTRGVIATCSKIESITGELVQKNILSSGYQATQTRPPQTPVSLQRISDARILTQLSNVGLRELTHQLRLPTDGSRYDLIQRITNVDLSIIPQEIVVPVANLANDLPPITRVTQTQLERFKVPQLRSICKQHNIRQGKSNICISFDGYLGKRKADTIRNILSRVSALTQGRGTLDQLYQRLQTTQFPARSPMVKVYGDWFNAVDLHDRYLYRVEYKHKIQNWHTKYFFCILESVVVNSWCLYAQSHPISLVDFRKLLALQLLGRN